MLYVPDFTLRRTSAQASMNTVGRLVGKVAHELPATDLVRLRSLPAVVGQSPRSLDSGTWPNCKERGALANQLELMPRCAVVQAQATLAPLTTLRRPYSQTHSRPLRTD